MTIFRDPLRWSRAAVRSPWGLGVLIGVHLTLSAVTGAVLLDFGLAFLLVPLILVGIVMPFGYLYALRRVLALFEEGKPIRS